MFYDVYSKLSSYLTRSPIRDLSIHHKIYRLIPMKLFLRGKKGIAYLHAHYHSRLSYLHNPGKEPLQLLTLAKMLEEKVTKMGDKKALVSTHDNRTLTFSDVFDRSRRLAAGFHQLGLKKGDRLGLWMPNVVEFVITFLAAAQAGLITALINPQHPEEELRYCLNKVGVKALVCLDYYKHLEFYNTLCNVVPELKKADLKSLRSKTVPTLDSVITVSENTLRGTYNYDEVEDMAPLDYLDKIEKFQKCVHSDDITAIMYTSGTTGKPKATCLTQFQMINCVYDIAKRMEMDKNEDNLCLQVPLFTAFGTNAGITAALHFGTTLTLASPLYSPSATLKVLEQERCSTIYGTPTMYSDLLKLQLKEKRKLYLAKALVGGSTVTPQLTKDIRTILGIKTVFVAYGLTECTSIVFFTLPNEDGNLVLDTVGYICNHVQLKVVDSNNNLVPFGEPGELCIRGFNVMRGYWDNAKETSKMIGKDGWLKTGDVFVLHENGYGTIKGRIRDVILRGGENIFPKEIEDVLNDHPDVLQAHVVGLSHNRLGEEVCACVEVKPGSKFDYDSMVEFCQKKLRRSEIPSKLKIMTSFPTTISGKVSKRVLKETVERML